MSCLEISRKLDNFAGKLAAIFEDTRKKEDFQQADLAHNRLFTEGKYSAFYLVSS